MTHNDFATKIAGIGIIIIFIGLIIGLFIQEIGYKIMAVGVFITLMGFVYYKGEKNERRN